MERQDKIILDCKEKELITSEDIYYITLLSKANKLEIINCDHKIKEILNICNIYKIGIEY